MSSMIKPNWEIFKIKFNDNPQNSFEWFCYSLFCKEFEKTSGIFRYKNQSALETDPIAKDGEVIGWQAKFYGEVLSAYKIELIEILDKVKRDYPNITMLILYTNQEWGQNKGKEPQGKKDIEKKAKELGIKLEWRTASYFESPFVSVDNEIIAKHFYSLDKSIYELINEQQRHSENILNEIRTYITYNGYKIEIDRNKDLDKIKTSSERILILSGVAGVGKTAVIKKLYEQKNEKAPFYIFKAIEFELRNINELFTGYSYRDFIGAHIGESDKTIVIDSAEKLLDLKNPDPFKEILTALVNENWKIIFTTRNNYLEDLNYQFFEIYQIAPLNIRIQNLTSEELGSLSSQYNFTLPKDEKLLELIKNPFYLNEYLKFYREDEEINYTDFRERSWNKNIKKTKPAREQCFLQIASKRANEGQFYINSDCESGVLDELRMDGILGYETAGYFITHDIHEEWALEKNIESVFKTKSDNKTLFRKIGNSLPMRRAFGKWVSEKLLLENSQVKTFIEDVLKSNEVDSVWKDEILVSVLLSDYSEKLFEIFKDELLTDSQELLKKLTFLLRIACKEVDEEYFSRLGLKNINLFSLEYVLTKPKGRGWQSLIKFVFEKLDAIGIKNIYFVLPIIHDWNSKFKAGETTKYSSLIALRYYQGIIEEGGYLSRGDTKDHLLQTILYGSSEIKSELEDVFKQILKNKWKKHREPYYDLSKAILSKIEGISVAKVLPVYVLQLADLFWSYIPPKKKEIFHEHHGIGIERYFNIDTDHSEYHPASSYQTPIYWLLKFSLKETIDFILKFTNKTVEYFAKSDFAKNEVEEVDVFIETEKPIKQYISNRLWCAYRGTQVVPDVLEAMHMALEKFFIENGKDADSKTIEDWLLYLLRNSKSASISAVITSIVSAYPGKTFNVAKALFKTKEFYLYETGRLVLDQGQKDTLLMLKNKFSLSSKNELHENERLEACDAKHRKWTLENILFNYQIIKSKETSEEEAKNRQIAIWEILDDYYNKLPNSSEETAADKTWRLFLARMDRRKMNPVLEENKDGVIIHWNPELEPELKEYSDKSLEKSYEPFKHTSLRLWADYKMRNDDQYKQYDQYEKDPKLALKEAKEIISELDSVIRSENIEPQQLRNNQFYLTNHSVPTIICSALVRNHWGILSEEDKAFCKALVFKAATFACEDNYRYQISDGVQAAISALPKLFNESQEEKETLKMILLRTLFNDFTVDGVGTSFNVFSILAIRTLWESNFKDAQSILFGYLLLKPKFDGIVKEIRKKYYKNNNYQPSENETTTKFIDENKDDLQRIINNQLLLDDIDNIEQIDLDTLNTAFQLIPLKTDNAEHKIIVNKIISVFAVKFVSGDREDKIDYTVRHGVLKKIAYFLLSSPKEELQGYLKPFLDKFNGSEAMAELFEEFVVAEDHLNSYEIFWEIWNLFKEKVIEICGKGDGYWYIDKIIKKYLFAIRWKESTTEWHTLKDENKRFFKEISQKLRHCPSALYAISKLLNDIGSSYLDDGIFWLSNMLKNNENLLDAKLEINTIYYLENNVRKYIYKNREKIKKTIELKQNVLIILEFLIKRGSVIGYILRENIL